MLRKLSCSSLFYEKGLLLDSMMNDALDRLSVAPKRHSDFSKTGTDRK